MKKIFAILLCIVAFASLAFVAAYAQDVEVSTLPQASVRISTDHSGLRFKTKVPRAVIEGLVENYGEENVFVGTLIAPTDMLDGGELTHGIGVDGVDYIDVKALYYAPFVEDGDDYVYAGSIVNINEKNLTRRFTGVGYVKVVGANGVAAYVYSDTAVSKSIDEIAATAYNDIQDSYGSGYEHKIESDDPTLNGKYGPYTAEQREIIGKLIAARAEIELFVDGASDFVLVYDGTDFTLKSSVTNFVSEVKTKYGVQLTTKTAASAVEPCEKEIVVGGVRESGRDLAARLGDVNDFGISVEENRLVLCATNAVSYNYLFEYLVYEGFAKTSAGDLTLGSEDEFVYSDSEMYGVTYPEFHREHTGTCEQDFMLKTFIDGTFVGSNGVTMKYRLYVPADYTPDKEYPVIFFLHGAGHRGNDNAAPVKGIIYNLFNHENPQIDDAIVLVPQCPSGYQWVDWPWANGSYSVDSIPESKAMKTALELLDKVESEYSTDTDRYYAFGLSMGGFGTWDVIMRHSDRFAAAVTLCGGADPTKASVLVDMPIWTVHSLDDTSVPVKGTQDMVKAIKDAGGTKIVYDELNGYNHGIGTISAKREEIFTWLFAQSK